METVIMHAYDIMYYNERADLLVETFYGKNMGSWRVLDALYTLGFNYPKRSAYFYGKDAVDAMNKFKQNHPTFEIWDCYSAE